MPYKVDHFHAANLAVAGSFRVSGGNTSTFGNDGLLHINSRSTTHGSETVALQTTIDGRALTAANPGTHGGESRNVLALQPDGGYVGIGTASPDGRLHICSGTSGDCHLILHADTDNNNETDNPKIMFRQDGAIYTAEIGIDNSGNKLAIRGTSGIAFYDGGTSSTDINHLESTSTERMRIEAGGNVGIGTASPGAKLHVNGAIYAPGHPVQYVGQNVHDIVVYGNSVGRYITPLDITITPKFSNSKIMLHWVINGEAHHDQVIRIYRFISSGASTLIGFNSNNQGVHSGAAPVLYDTDHNSTMNTHTVAWVDTPNTTSAVTYRIFSRPSNNGTNWFRLNRTVGGGSLGQSGHEIAVSYKSAMEIAV